MIEAESAREISLVQTRALVKDLFEHSAWIYWTDFLLSMSVAYGAVALYLSNPIFSPLSLHRLHDRRLRSVSMRRIHSRNRAHDGEAHASFPRCLEHPVRHPRPDALLHVQEPCGPPQPPAFRDGDRTESTWPSERVP